MYTGVRIVSLHYLPCVENIANVLAMLSYPTSGVSGDPEMAEIGDVVVRAEVWGTT